MASFTTLSQLHDYMHERSSCTLKSTASNPVYGAGDPDAAICLIGEAPGKQEDLTGTPFVGASGRILDELLSSINLEREDVYITNTVKYRPPANRDPSATEKEACAGWLAAEITFVAPDIIVPLGRHAARHFLPACVISADHGQLFSSDSHGTPGSRLYPVFHPAASLYNPSLRPVLFADFAAIPDILLT